MPDLRGGRVRLTCRNLQLQRAYQFLGHLASPFSQQPSDASEQLFVGVVRIDDRGHLASHFAHSGLLCDLSIFEFDRRFAAKN